MIELMFSANRYMWNELVARTKGRWYIMSFEEMDEELRPLTTKKHIKSLGLGIASVHSDCFNSAYEEFKDAIVTVKALSASRKAATGQGFKYPEQLKFKTKKQGGVSITVHNRNFTYLPEERRLRFYPTFLGEEGIAIKTDLVKAGIGEIHYSAKLCLHHGHYYLMVPRHVPTQPSASEMVCALDPGVRTFMTSYDAQGQALEISSNQDHLHQRKRKIEKLQSSLAKEKNKNTRRRLKKQIQDLYRRISNCVNDLHHKTAKMLAESYKYVLIPEFQTSKMAHKEKRKIGPTTSNDMLTLSHYKFRQILEQKMKLRQGHMILCTEEYTSKTCGACGRLNHYLRSKKIFSCPYLDCKVRLDRDINGARNILIKNYNLLISRLSACLEPPGIHPIMSLA